MTDPSVRFVAAATPVPGNHGFTRFCSPFLTSADDARSRWRLVRRAVVRGESGNLAPLGLLVFRAAPPRAAALGFRISPRWG
jgi:hypothetical protein